MEQDNKELKKWTPEAEILLKEWSEKASCYRWLNDRCEKVYRRRYYYGKNTRRGNRRGKPSRKH